MLLMSIITLVYAETEPTIIDFDEIEITTDILKPSVVFISSERQLAKSDLLIPDLRQLVLEKEREKELKRCYDNQ